MAYTDHEPMFVNADGNALGSVEVPESCIDSAEFIIRRIATKGARLSRGKVGPDMMAHFGNMVVNASQDDLMDLPARPADYAFTDVPQVGEGIILLNKTKTDLSYNMHLGAVVARSAGRASISHMFELVKSYSTKPLIVLHITSAADFAVQTFGADAKLYAVGLLRKA